MSKDITTVRVKQETRNRLGEHGSKNETFDEILNKLMDEVEKEG